MAAETSQERHERHLRIARGTNKTLKLFGQHAQPMRRLRGGIPGQQYELQPAHRLRERGPKRRVTTCN